jgi:hypothetical protein
MTTEAAIAAGLYIIIESLVLPMLFILPKHRKKRHKV